jgi:hypothetical protein
MQPLNRVKPAANVVFGEDNTMQKRPELAVLVAECITQFANLESMMGLSLALILDANQKAVLAMYSAFDSRASQMKLLKAAAESELEKKHCDIFDAVITLFVKPAMRDRDKFAHWVWGYAPELPDALLLMEPREKTPLHAAALNPPSPIQWDYSKIFVVRKDDLSRALHRFHTAIDMYGRFSSTNWKFHTTEMRAEWIDKLSNEPPICEFLDHRHRGSPQDPSSTEPQSFQSNDHGQ